MLGAHGLLGNSVWAVTVTPALIATYLALVAALVAGAAVIVWVARRYRRPAPDHFNPLEELARFRALAEQGEISAEEFARIRAQLGAAEPQRPQPPEGRGAAADAFTPRDPGP